MSRNCKPLFAIAKRPMILLEVLIALALIAMCALPLLTPHFAMLNQQKKFISTMKLDHHVHLLYIDVLERLQKNKISWNLIQDHTEIPIDEDMWVRIGEYPLPNLRGSYHFEEIKSKSNNVTNWSAYLLNLVFTFEKTHLDQKEPPSTTLRKFPYTVYVLRHTAEVPVIEDENEKQKSSNKNENAPEKN